MFITTIIWNGEEQPGAVEFYSETFIDALEKIEIRLVFKTPTVPIARSIEIFEAEGKFAQRKLIVSMRTIR